MSASRFNEQPKASAKPGTSEPPKQEPVEVAKAETESAYVVAKYCQLVTSRGVLSQNDRVLVSDLSDGQEHMDRLVASGVVVKL